MTATVEAYAPSIPVTISLASLATQFAWYQSVRQSSVIDNSSGKYLDYLLGGHIKIGSTGSSMNSYLYVFVASSLDDTTWPDTLGAVDATVTLTALSCVSFLKMAVIIPMNGNVAGAVAHFSGISVAGIFGGVLPKKFVVVVVNLNGGNLDATASNHVIAITPVYLTTV